MDQQWIDEFFEQGGLDTTEYDCLANFNNKQLHGDNSYKFMFPENGQFSTERDPVGLGRMYYEQGDVPKAIEALEEALHRDKANLEAWKYMALVLNELGESELMLICAQTAYDHNRLDRDVLVLLIIAQYNESRDSEMVKSAAEWVLSFSNLYERYPTLQENVLGEELASAFTQLTESDFEQQDRGNFYFLKALVTSMYDKENSNIADCIKKAAVLRPFDPVSWNRVGASLTNQERPEEAIKYLDRALTLRPTYVSARINLGIAQMSMGKYTDAAHLFVDSIERMKVLEAQNVKFKQLDQVISYLRAVLIHMQLEVSFSASFEDLKSLVEPPAQPSPLRLYDTTSSLILSDINIKCVE